ncbi:MAG: ATP-binding protein [Chitinophagaceae bacterium]
MSRIILILVCSLGLQQGVYAQTDLIEKLKREVRHAANDNDRLQALLDLFEEGRNIHRDTLERFALQARELAGRVGDKRQKALAELAYANTYYRWGWIDSALAIAQPLLGHLPVQDPMYRDSHFKVARQLAVYHVGTMKYSEALEILYDLIAKAEKYGDSITAAVNLNSIGSIALQRSAPRTAIGWLDRALLFNTGDARFEPVLAAIYTNMAEALTKTGKLDSALYYIEKGVELFRKQQNLSSLAHALQRESNLYIKLHRLDKAEAVLKQMIEVRQLTNDGSIWLDDNLSLIEFYLETGQAQKAVDYCLLALQRGDVRDSTAEAGKVYSNNVNLRLSYYEALARSYKALGNQEKYQETLERIISAKDSFYLANSAEAIAEVQTKYEVQKKENTIIQQQLALVRKNNLFYLTVAVVAFVAVLTTVFFIGYRKREKLKVQLLLEREKADTLRAIAEAEENERKRIAADLHDNLGVYAASIASNLDFIGARNRAEDELNALHELRHNSQAIVSQLADTIWALNKETLTLTAISDRVKIFLQRVRPSYPGIQLEVEESVQRDLSFSPIQAFHLYRVIQESIVNALKHSQATRVTVGLSGNFENWSVKIDDNGRGMTDIPSEKAGSGNGMANMRKRAQASGWNISWLTLSTGGTRVLIEPASGPRSEPGV